MLGKVSKLRFGLSLLGSRGPEFFGALALRFWINVRGGDKGALSPDRLVAYLPGNNHAGFGRTEPNLLKLGLGGSLPGQILSCVETSTKA